MSVKPRELDSGTETQIADALRRGEKVEAIRLYQERTGAGLNEAKKHIEAWTSAPATNKGLGAAFLSVRVRSGDDVMEQ